jgi:tetratricopeptide (TPR) repeat protein
VHPGPVRPDYWSPHLRPFPDYAAPRRSLYRAGPDHRFGPFGGPIAYDHYGCYDGDAEAAYQQGRHDADREFLWYIASRRAGRLLNQHAEKFDAGVRHFRDGRYEQALINLLGAAEADQGRSAPRLHAGHALFALGRYREAVEMLARAFELSPLLPYKPYDLREEYGRVDEFAAHLDALRNHVAAHADDAAGHALLGYVTYYTTGPAEARPFLLAARRLDRRSYFIPKLLEASKGMQARGSSGSPGQARTPTGSGQRRPREAVLRKAHTGRA